jgi:transposase
MTMQSRRKFTTDFKTKVVLESLKERSSIEQLAKKFEVHPTQINSWKREFLSNASAVFNKKEGESPQPDIETDKLYAQIGRLKMENDFLKKKLS